MNTHQAIKTGNIDLIKERIATKQICTNYKFGGLSALHLAIMYGQEEIVYLLLAAGSPINSLTDSTSKSSFGIPKDSTPLYLALNFNKLSIFETLLKAGAVVNDETLIIAVERENVEAVKCCLEKIKWLRKVDMITTIFESIVKHDNQDLLKLFIKPELIDVNTILSSGNSLLYHSVEANKLQICRTLVDNGAEVNWAKSYYFNNDHCHTTYIKPVLSAAVETKNCEMVKLLLDSGAAPDGDFSKHNNSYRKDIPIVIAVENNSIDIVSLLIDVDTNIYIRKYGSDASYDINNTLLGIAINNQFLDVVKLLIESAAVDLNNDFHLNGKLFEKAVSTKNEELITYLLTEGVVAMKYLNYTSRFFPKIEDQILVQKHFETAKELIYNNNIQVLTNFLAYLNTDQSNLISKLPEDIRGHIINYVADNEHKLNSLTFENYIHYHPIECGEVLEVNKTGAESNIEGYLG